MTTRDEVLEHIEDALGLVADEEDIILFDGMEDAFLGVAERFEPITRVTVTTDHLETDRQDVGGEHRYFAVYSYEKMVDILTADMSDEDAREYLEFNTVGAYVGPNTPAIMRDLRT